MTTLNIKLFKKEKKKHITWFPDKSASSQKHPIHFLRAQTDRQKYLILSNKHFKAIQI